MAANGSRSPTTTSKTEHLDENNCKNKYCIQRVPPLSLQQFLRYASGVVPGGKEWKPSGKFRPPAFHLYLSPETRKQLRRSEPIWHTPGPYHDKRPTSLSPEKREESTVQEPIWHPPGKANDKPLPYFDPPSLRWSIQDLLRSMAASGSQSYHPSKSAPSSRKTLTIEETENKDK